MGNKQIAKQFLDNLFINNDLAYDVVADNVRVNWPGFGMDDIIGKENLRAFLDKGGPDSVLEQTVNNVVAEGDTVISTGSMITERNGKQETSHFADVYQISDGKIVNIVSYMVMDNKNNSQE